MKLPHIRSQKLTGKHSLPLLKHYTSSHNGLFSLAVGGIRLLNYIERGPNQCREMSAMVAGC